MVLAEARQPLAVSTLIHSGNDTITTTTTTASSTSSTTTTKSTTSTTDSSPTSSPTAKSSSFASEKRRAIHENAKKNQRNLIEGKGKKSALSFMYQHQIDVPLGFIATIVISHYLLELPLAAKFLYLQNQDSLTGLYSKAWSDLYFIFFWIVVFTFLRAFVMTQVLKPVALWAKVKREHQRNRFQEEGWVCMYYTCSWILGMYVLWSSPVWNNWWFWFKPEAFFEGYPHTRLPHVMIWYYYVQFAFWLQQIFVLYVEAPRKDFWAMIAHHTVTLLLIGGSALSNFWRAGNAVFVVMDLADIILAFSKSIKYLGVASRVCDGFFACFMVCWLYTRHFLYGYILHSFMFTAYEMIPFELDIANGKWYCRELAWLPVLGLALLQILMVYWFALILRIVFKILKGHSAEDDRSDEEHDPMDEVKEKH
ncbi:sphingosine N-acyltransferase lag1 [Podila epicladia]|nr:sphingosine N-acyltransferase lag1 [Podila epicladia]